MKQLIATPFLLLIAMSTADASELRSPEEVKALLETSGYVDIREVEYDDGLWEAEATRSDGRRVDLHVDPLNREVLDAADEGSWISREVLSDQLRSKGYTQLRDLEREDGLWELEAMDPQGQAVELRLSARDGRILHSQPDHID
jgi:uncharacterized membrane protein YkoI